MNQNAEISGSQAWMSIRIIRGAFNKHQSLGFTPWVSSLIGFGWRLSIGVFNSSPGDSNVHPGLRTTDLEIVSTIYMKYIDNIIRSAFYWYFYWKCGT